MQDWLFTSGNCVVAHDFDQRERVDFKRGPVRAFLEQKSIFPGVLLYRGATDGRSSFRIAMEGTSVEGQLVLGTMLGGTGTVAMEGAELQDWREDGRFFALAPIGRRVAYEVRANSDWQVVALRLDDKALDFLDGGDALPGMVRDALAGRSKDTALTAPLGAALRNVSRALMRPVYSGAMDALYRQAKVLELLVHHFDVLAETNDGSTFIPGYEQRAMREVRDCLLAHLRDPPDLQVLAAMVGMTPRRLNRNFRALYGTTVFDYLRDARLDAARVALEEGSQLPLKQLAWNLGYNQASNFVTAFRRRFGMSPGAYRRASVKGR